MTRNGTKHIGFTTKRLKTNEKVQTDSKRDQNDSNLLRMKHQRFNQPEMAGN